MNGLRPTAYAFGDLCCNRAHIKLFTLERSFWCLNASDQDKSSEFGGDVRRLLFTILYLVAYHPISTRPINDSRIVYLTL